MTRTLKQRKWQNNFEFDPRQSFMSGDFMNELGFYSLLHGRMALKLLGNRQRNSEKN